MDVARSCCCGICVPGKTAVFHRQDMVANSTVVEWVRAVCARLGGKVVVAVVEAPTYYDERKNN